MGDDIIGLLPTPVCPECNRSMKLSAVIYRAAKQSFEYRCIVCAWRTQRESAGTLQG